MAEWFDGTLKNVDNITNDKLKTKYLVRYDLDRHEERDASSYWPKTWRPCTTVMLGLICNYINV